MNNKINLREAISIGIGGMVGGGIFAVLGLAISFAKGSTPIAFLFAGLIALITSYSYVKLSLTYPDRGGTVKFINQGFGETVFSGGMNNLLWTGYMIMISLYASAFGSYAQNLFPIINSSLDFHIYATAIVILATFINYYSIKMVGRIESYAVIIKLTILVFFVLVGLYGLTNNPHASQLSVENWVSPFVLLAGGMVIFVAYEGFELIANVAPDIENPKKNIPKAYYYSVIFVILLYVMIAVVTVGSLSFSELDTARDYVLAQAANPMLGQIGFTVITIAALISTFSAINASLYGGSRVSYEISEDDELPHQFTFQLWNHPVGLMITTIVTITLTNALNLESISTAGSISFLLIFAVVNFAGFKLSVHAGSKRAIHLIGFLFCIIALLVLTWQQIISNILGVVVAVFIVLGCFIIEWVYKFAQRKNIYVPTEGFKKS